MHLFVYGTLQSHGLMAVVAGTDSLDATVAQLDGYQLRQTKESALPFVVKVPGTATAGILWRDLTPQQITRLDTYEGAFGYTIEDVVVSCATEKLSARCYLPPSGFEAGLIGWSLDEWQEQHLAPALLAATELFAHRPLPDHGALRHMWPMIEARAWSKHRATTGPTTIRHKQEPDDVRVLAKRPPQGSFFRLQSIDVTHRRFDNSRSHVLVRETFLGVDAALVLPYDPVRDRVLLVEQLRMGPLARHDPNPWMLEPVAGIVDAREAPEEAARREVQEEAGLTLQRLEAAGTFYASPGASTDYFYSYVGLCSLQMTSSYIGGLPAEGEDLRLHPVSFEDAMELADSGEVATAPLLYLLNWLARHRDRLRAMT